tara:strand:+ start:133 stop:576 length:444 start_codon:yes stop_codon:yes gene_type:complete
MPGKDKNRGSKRFMDAIKKGQEFSASMKAPAATPRMHSPVQNNKFIGELKKAQETGKDSFVVNGKTYETKGAAFVRLNRNMEMETMTAMNPMGAAAISGPNTMTNPNMVLRRASKMSNTKVKPISTRYKQTKTRVKDKDLYKLKKVF